MGVRQEGGGGGPGSSPADDLEADQLPKLSWGGPHTRSSLDELFRVAEDRGRRVHSWYLTEKRPKARRSRRFRAAAIAFTALAGLFPLLHGLYDRISEQWGFILLALAAASVGADRFFGFSTAWMRYMLSAVRLEEDLYRFQYEWTELQALGGGAEPDDEAVHAQLACIRRFSASVSREVRVETEAWVSEFTSNVSQLEAMTRRADERAARAGASPDAADPPATSPPARAGRARPSAKGEG